jgi:hypothetical protein
MQKSLVIFFIIIFCSAAAFAQKNSIRGNVFDKETGEPVSFANVVLKGTNIGTLTDIEGFYNLANVPSGDYQFIVTYIGYDSTIVDISIKTNDIINKTIYLVPSQFALQEVSISAKKEAARTEVQISKITITPKLIKSLPSTGGEADLVQYLQVLPGVISTGDQGGQLYIRGGSPVQNKVLLDGMTIYNPFHSIGFFSVFETETIRSVDVYTGGFNAEYGGRISAIVDIKTKEGNRKRFGGLVSASPFQSKVVLEGPIIPLKEDGKGGSASFLLTGKRMYLDKTGSSLYNYAARDSSGLPFNYTDIYGKASFMTGNGTKLNLFGFNYTDNVNYSGVAEMQWSASGGGANFTLVPQTTNLIIGGIINYSDYRIELLEFSKTNKNLQQDPRTNSIKGFTAGLDFTYYGTDSETKYGFEINGFKTDFSYINPRNITFEQTENTTELTGFLKIRKKFGRLVMEPSLRFQYYASLNDASLEPRLGFKLNASQNLRFKFATGLYSQNLISTVNEDDIVNLFVGFLAGPEESFYKPGTKVEVDTRLQKGVHAIGGVEIDLSKDLELNIEPYFKYYSQLINLNRNKTVGADPNFVTETGTAKGIDLSMRYQRPKFYLWATYSLGYVNRDDGFEIYPTNFDRRHNVNLLATWNFGKDKAWEFSTRWNYGSGFAFTLTQAFYTNFDFSGGIGTDVLTGNPEIKTILSDNRNTGRLSDYHRLDISLKRTFKFSKYSSLDALLSLTNAYNRKNIFYVERLEQSEKVYQLPIIPSATMIFNF